MSGFIYAIENDDCLVKVGWSRDPRKRLSKINSDTSSPCVLRGIVSGTREDEAELHARLAPERAHREWYRRGPLVEALMRSMTPAPLSRREAEDATGSPLRRWRARNGLTLMEAASLFGVSHAHVWNIERMDGPASTCGVSADVLRKIFEVTDGEITPNDVLGLYPRRAIGEAA